MPLNPPRNAGPWTRRRFAQAAASTVSLAAGACRRTPRGRPNILWLIAEDLCPDLSCYGNSPVRTPHLDRLSREGIRFDRAYVTGPICSPSRSALATGVYQTTLGAHHHRSHRDDAFRLPQGVHLFTHYLRQAGYHTSLVTEPAPGLRTNPKTDFNFQTAAPFEGSHWSQRRPGQPFYAQINFSETHRPFHRFPDRPIDPASVTLPPWLPDHPVIRQDWAMYLETMQRLDEKVGAVLRRLDEEKLRENTVIFFFGDNGRPLPRGKGFLYEGGIHVPLIVRFPEEFLPAGAAPASVRDDLVSSLDITASTLALAGLEPLPRLHGRPLFGPHASPRDRVFAAVDRCDESMDRVRAVRDRRFKYLRNYLPDRPYCQPNVYRDTEYPSLRVLRELGRQGKLNPEEAHFTAPRRPAEELYDLNADPHELHNLADSPAHLPTLRDLRARLDSWVKETSDQAEIPERVLPRSYQYRVSKVEEWCSRDCRLTRARGLLRVELFGKQHRLMRGFVTEGGSLELRFRARSRGVPRATFRWGTVTEFDHPSQAAPIAFSAGRAWREYVVPFQAAGDLALLAFDFSNVRGVLEFDWIRLFRISQGRAHPLAAWGRPGQR